MIRTVLGDLAPEDIGHAQCHEHIWLERGASFASSPALVADDPEKSLAELKEYYAAGGRLIVDAQPTGCGRNAKMLAWLSKESQVAIVAVSGFHKQMFFDEKEMLEWNVDKLTARYVEELTEGMIDADGEKTDIRSGMLKVAMENNWNTDPAYIRLFTAVAKAAVITGAPVMVHTEKENDIPAMLAWFESQGVPAERILVCHLDRTHYDAEYHIEVLKSGCSFCYDSVHRLKYVSEEEEMALLLKMKEAGVLDQIVIALDTTNQRLRAYAAPDMGLDYILETYIPALKGNGFSEEEIEKLTKVNAKRILSFSEPASNKNGKFLIFT